MAKTVSDIFSGNNKLLNIDFFMLILGIFQAEFWGGGGEKLNVDFKKANFGLAPQENLKYRTF